MANDDTSAARGGLLPLEQPYGTVRKSYYRLTTSAVAVYIGQPMDLDGQGQVVPALSSTLGTAIMIGPCLGFSSDSRGKMGLPNAMSLITQAAYLPAATDAYVLIADDPNQIFTIQEATSGTALSSANVGNSINFGYLRTGLTSGSTVTGYSQAELRRDGVSATAGSGTLMLIGLADNMNSDGTYNSVGDYAKWRVRIQNHRLQNAVAGTTTAQ